MKNAMRGFVGIGLLVLATWVLAADLTQAAQRGPAQSERFMVTKLVNCWGKVTRIIYGAYGNSFDLQGRKRNLQAEYEKAKRNWDKISSAGSKPGETLNERVEPVAPIVEILANNMKKKSEAENMWLNTLDYAVYAIRIGDTLQYHVAYAHSDAFAKALARADYAKLSNARLRSGGEKAGGELPQPTVEKLTEALSRHDAETELRWLVKATRVATSAE